MIPKFTFLRTLSSIVREHIHTHTHTHTHTNVFSIEPIAPRLLK
jgi:hypothetical protein